MRTRIAVASLLALTAACDAARSRTTLAECAAGWWTGLAQTCVVACMAQPPPAACGHGDCEQVPVLGLRGERFARGTIASSAEAGALQFVGAVFEGAYSVSGSTVTLDGSAQAGQCDGTTLTVGSVVYHRACPALAGALDASAADAWSSQPVAACP